MNAPEVSVVMSVFNGAPALPETLASVLGQQGCRFELIVVDDGSTDATPAILQAWATRDSRVRVVRQVNTGLTIALARGCAQARGEFIARQDCGDVSLPGRLQRQCAYLRAHPDVVMVACAVRTVGPGNEPLFVIAHEGEALHDGLSVQEGRPIKGPPHHGGTMFSRSAYLQTGGYRAFFRVAQDIDLWLRLREIGQCRGEAEVGYEARLEAGSISASRRTEQLRYAELAGQCALRRRDGRSERDILEMPGTRFPRAPHRNAKLEHARFLYFIGSCLRRSDPPAARRYYWEAFRTCPLLVKSLARIATG